MFGAGKDGLGDIFAQAFANMDSPHLQQAQKVYRNTPKDLRAAHERLMQNNTFRPGDLVTWKEGLVNRKVPDAGKPAIVLEILPEPIVDLEEEIGSAFYRSKVDMVIGVYIESVEGNVFLTFHVEQNRFKPYDEKPQTP